MYSFICIASYTVVNIFIAIIQESYSTSQEAMKRQRQQPPKPILSRYSHGASIGVLIFSAVSMWIQQILCKFCKTSSQIVSLFATALCNFIPRSCVEARRLCQTVKTVEGIQGGAPVTPHSVERDGQSSQSRPRHTSTSGRIKRR